jgi:hypothetical protein
MHPMPMAMYCDLARYGIKYDNQMSGPNGFVAVHQAAMVAQGYGAGGGAQNFTYPMPTWEYYEFAFTEAIPGGPSHTDKSLRQLLSHDIMYHPAYYDVIMAYLAWLQQAGPTGSVGAETATLEAMGGFRQGGGTNQAYNCTNGYDNLATSLWGIYMWQGQQRGYGTSNLMAVGNGDGVSGDGKPHDKQNQSVIGQALADWIAGVYVSPPPNGGGGTPPNGGGSPPPVSKARWENTTIVRTRPRRR